MLTQKCGTQAIICADLRNMARFCFSYVPPYGTQVHIGRQRDWYSRAALTITRKDRAMTNAPYIAGRVLAIAKTWLTDAEFDALTAAQEFENEDDWRGPRYRYDALRFLAYIKYFGIEGKAPPECADWSEAVGDREYTYFALGDITGLIKIGRSRRPEHRIGTLQHDRNGEPSTELVIIQGGGLERQYHNIFAKWREDGEWFAPHPDILAEIERLANPLTTHRPAR